MDHRALSFGSFEIRPAQRVLIEDGRPVPLGSRALDILVLLVERAGQVVGKDELIAQVWPNAVVEEATLRVHIAALRRHLHEGRAGQRYIVNVTGRGYSFVAPVEAVQRAGPHRRRRRRLQPGLPLPVGRLVGRDETVAALAAKLRLRRFVTLVGPGGVGKTAVALHAAAAVAAEVDGVVFVDLAPVQQPALVPSALASALGLPARQDDPSGELAEHLAERRLLLVLDSCEHVVDAVARLTECIFASAPQVHLLATSREPLRSGGEWVTRLGPLELPPADGSLGAAEAAAWPAVQLFVERAAAALDSFRSRRRQCRARRARSAAGSTACRWPSSWPRRASMPSACRACRRCSTTGSACCWPAGRRGAQARHQTLHATLEWSYGLLSAPEQTAAAPSRHLRRALPAAGAGGGGLRAGPGCRRGHLHGRRPGGQVAARGRAGRRPRPLPPARHHPRLCPRQAGRSRRDAGLRAPPCAALPADLPGRPRAKSTARARPTGWRAMRPGWARCAPRSTGPSPRPARSAWAWS